MNIESTAYNVLDEAVKQATDNGLVVVVSAGNDGIDAATYSPAHVSEAITVGSYDIKSKFSGFSNYGSVVDILAPGDFTVSLSNDPNDVAGGWAIIESGTSMAAAHVTGAAALLLSENANASPEDVQQGLQSTAIANISDVPAGTTNKTVYVGEEGGMVNLQVPPFFQYAITSGGDIEIKHELFIGSEHGTEINTSVYTNGDLIVGNDGFPVHISGFGYHSGSVRPQNLVEGALSPLYNPANLQAHILVDPIEIPSFNVSEFRDKATRTSPGNLFLDGHYELGTRENPVIWYVGGQLMTKGDVTFSGYGIFLVKKDIQIKHNMTTLDVTEETTLGLYTERSVQFKSNHVQVSAQIFVNRMVMPKGFTTIYGSITAGDKVDFSSQGPTTIYYRPASPALTEPLWPVENYDNGFFDDQTPPEPDTDDGQTLPIETAPRVYLEVKKHEYKSRPKRGVKLEGIALPADGSTGVTVTVLYTSDRTLFGTVTTRRGGKWSLSRKGLAKQDVPCSVDVTAGDATATVHIRRAPRECR